MLFVGLVDTVRAGVSTYRIEVYFDDIYQHPCVDNVGESLYGTEEWDKHWSKLNSDGNITWGRMCLILTGGRT